MPRRRECGPLQGRREEATATSAPLTLPQFLQNPEEAAHEAFCPCNLEPGGPGDACKGSPEETWQKHMAMSFQQGRLRQS
eukprot:scaffold120931_cov18-Tisochrysis_lutea.AAC.1